MIPHKCTEDSYYCGLIAMRIGHNTLQCIDSTDPNINCRRAEVCCCGIESISYLTLAFNCKLTSGALQLIIIRLQLAIERLICED